MEEPMNVDLLLRVKAHILAEPRRFDMDDWVRKSKAAPCGTVACIAGWAGLLNNPQIEKTYDVTSIDFFQPRHNGLQLTEDESDRLFYEGEWPEPFCSEYYDAESSSERAAVAVRRIDHFIETNGRE
jgi:hypothetical protein